MLKDDYPIVLVDPAQDRMRNKRFDGNDHLEDTHIVYNGKCFCGMSEGVIHHHQYKE